MLNKVMLIGRLGQDVELKYAASGTAICTLSLATDESYVDRDGNKVERTEWHRVVCYSRQAENCANYLAKGSLCHVEGKLQTRKWQDQQGQDRYTTEVIAQRVTFLGRKPQGEQSDQGTHQPPSQNQQQRSTNRQQPPQSQQRQPQGQQHYDDMGPAFPPYESGIDDVPF